MLGVNAAEDLKVIQRYARNLGLTFPLLLDPQQTLSQLYGVAGVPTTFLLGRDGRTVALAAGNVPTAIRSSPNVANPWTTSSA